MKTQRLRKIRVSKLLHIPLLVASSILLTKIYPVASQDSQPKDTIQIQSPETESNTKDSTPETTEDGENQIPNIKELNDLDITTIEEPENSSGGFLSRIEEQLLLFLSILINFLLGAIAFWLKQNEEQLQKTASKRLDQLIGLKSLPKVGPNVVINSVMVIGLGGSGKTSLCRAVTGDPNANPEIATPKFQIYSTAKDIPGDNPQTRCKFYLADYPGQSYLEELVAGFIEQQTFPYSPMRYGYINSLILVVDLFRPPEVPNAQVPKQSELNKDKRIDENFEQWNDQALSAVFGMINSSSLKYICFFINKIDLLEPRLPNEEVEKRYLKLYEKLVKKAPVGVYLRIVVGSAKNGENVLTVTKDLIKYSVKPEDQNETT